MEPEKIDDIDQIRAMEQSLKETLDQIQLQKVCYHWNLEIHAIYA